MATDKEVKLLYKIIDEFGLSGEEVANLFLEWNGEQIVTEEFVKFIENEGYSCEGDEDEEEDEEEDEDEDEEGDG